MYNELLPIYFPTNLQNDPPKDPVIVAIKEEKIARANYQKELLKTTKEAIKKVKEEFKDDKEELEKQIIKIESNFALKSGLQKQRSWFSFKDSSGNELSEEEIKKKMAELELQQQKDDHELCVQLGVYEE